MVPKNNCAIVLIYWVTQGGNHQTGQSLEKGFHRSMPRSKGHSAFAGQKARASSEFTAALFQALAGGPRRL